MYRLVIKMQYTTEDEAYKAWFSALYVAARPDLLAELEVLENSKWRRLHSLTKTEFIEWRRLEGDE